MKEKYINAEGNHMLDVREYVKATTGTAMFTTRRLPLTIQDTIQTAIGKMAEATLLQAYLQAIYISTSKALRAKHYVFEKLDIYAISVPLGLLFC